MNRLLPILLAVLAVIGLAVTQEPDHVNSQAGGVDTALETRSWRGALGMPVRVTDYGAVGDGMMQHDAVISSTVKTVTSATANFPADIAANGGKYIRIAGGTTAGTAQVETATAAGTIATSIDSNTGFVYRYGTLNVTVTGNGIAGSPVTFPVVVANGDTAATWAGKVRNYLSNSLNLFDLYNVGGSSTSITLTGKRPRANDTSLNIQIAAGTNLTGFSTITPSANTTLGVATVDLITHVTQRNSATSIEVADQPGRPGTGVTIYYGTDDTAAIEAAQVAAVNTKAREVQFPEPPAGGCYLCNIVGRAHIALAGVDGGLTEFEFDPPSPLPDLSNRSKLPVVLIPAVATEPVIKYTTTGKIYGASVKRLSIMGSKEQVGTGLQFGTPDPSNSSFTGGGCVLEQVSISGFEYAFSSSSVAQIQADNCLFLYSRVCVFMGELTLGIGPTDTSVFNSCGTGGAMCDANWFISACKGVTIKGGDQNDGKRVAIICNGSTVSMSGINSESTTGSPFVVATGRLNLNGSNFLHLNGPLVDTIGSDNDVTIDSTRIVTVGAGALWQGKPIYCRTDQNSGYYDKLPKGGVIARYSDLGWNTLRLTEYTSEVYSSPAIEERRPTEFDEFVGNHVSPGPYGKLGWTATAVVGSAPTVQTPGQPTYPGNSMGLIYVTPSNSTSTNVLRFAVPVESLNPNITNGYFKFTWRAQLLSSSIGRYRIGMYSLDASSGDSAKPKNGIGVRIDRSVPDDTLKFEIINNETSYVEDTGIPYTELDALKEIRIWKTNEGFFFGLFPSPSNGAGIIYPFTRHSTFTGSINDYLAPCAVIAASTTGGPAALFDLFRVKTFEAGFN